MTVLSPPRPQESFAPARPQSLDLPQFTHPGWAALLADVDALA